MLVEATRMQLALSDANAEWKRLPREANTLLDKQKKWLKN